MCFYITTFIKIVTEIITRAPLLAGVRVLFYKRRIWQFFHKLFVTENTTFLKIMIYTMNGKKNYQIYFKMTLCVQRMMYVLHINT